MNVARTTIRDAVVADLGPLCAMNAASTPGVGPLTKRELANLMQIAAFTLVADTAAGSSGFILCMVEGCGYLSPNYLWFADRYRTFAYCDRIAILPQARGMQIGERLYGEAISRLAGRRDVLLCEVNLAPANPGSLRFHERLGFRPVGEAWSRDREKGVVYLEKRLEQVATTVT